MLRRLCAFLLPVIVGAALLPVASGKLSRHQKQPNLPQQDTYRNTSATFTPTPSKQNHYRFDDYVGVIDTAGTTWYDYQHNGSCGRMIDLDESGAVSVAWMNGLTDSIAGPRHAYANLWDPATESFLFGSTGYRIDNSQRAGYVCQTALGNGLFCFAFHQITTGSNAHATAAIPPTVSEPGWCMENGWDMEIIWPKIDADVNGTLHMISKEHTAIGPWPERIYYSRGVPEFDPDGFPIGIHWDSMSCGGFELWDTVTVIAPDVACSRRSERCAIAWCHSMDDLSEYPTQTNNDIYLRVSEDGGLNWSERINVTQWTPFDWEGNYDTLRCYTDLSILLDENDFIHIAFTTIRYLDYDPWPDIYIRASKIFHWSEETGYFSIVADGWFDGPRPGAWQRNVQRPSLSIDRTTGYLYCSYMRHDPETYTQSGFPMADAFVSVSVDNGVHWAIGTNVTNTTPDVVPAPAGQSMHERDVTVAPLVTNGILHMEYVLDKDAGGIPQGEGVATLNPVIYQRIPVDQIATWPLMPNYPMHYDSTGHPPDASTPAFSENLPQRFALHQNYPNPFNATTIFQFDLSRSSKVTLKIYNILGQEVLTLLSDSPLKAGTHKISMNASQLPSGIYIYRLQTMAASVSRKMLLLK